ncbi:MAG: hypothetical protein ACKV2V_20740 [Blastocatellia bacterium]
MTGSYGSAPTPGNGHGFPGNDAELDAILRQHARQSAGSAVSCAVFDPETAAAYLENALGQTARARYETHIADCGNCRRHTSALLRLMPADERPLPMTVDTVEVAEAAVPSSWTRLKRLFGFAGGRLNLAAAAGVAALVLLSLAIPVVMMQLQRGADITARIENAAPATEPASAPAANPAPAAVPADSANQVGQTAGAEAPAGSQQGAQSVPRTISSRGPMPAPPGQAPEIAPPPPSFSAPLPTQTNNDARMRSIGGQVQAPAKHGPAQIAQQQTPAEITPLNDAAPASQVKTPNTTVESGETRADKATEIAKATPDREAKKESSPALQAPKPTPLPAAARAYGERQEPAAKPTAGKATDAATGYSGAPARKQTISRRVGNKTFIYEDGVWRDTAIEANAKWPVSRLTRGSEAYDQTLTDIPSLRQFFNLGGQIKVLWQGTVYQIIN